MRSAFGFLASNPWLVLILGATGLLLAFSFIYTIFASKSEHYQVAHSSSTSSNTTDPQRSSITVACLNEAHLLIERPHHSNHYTQ